MLRQKILASAVTIAAASAQAADPLAVKVYNSDEKSFHVTSVVVSGEKEVMVIDSGFTQADAYRIAANVLDTGKTLKTILVSNADPDFYFGAELLKRLFPQAEVVATPAVVEKIKAKLATKVSSWTPKMGPNAPVNPIVPTPLNKTTLTVDGKEVQIRGTTGLLAHRPYVWIPSIGTVAGALGIFGNLHVWTADTQTQNERKAWVAELDEIAGLKPKVVVPGHMAAGTKLDESAVTYTRDYLVRFETELAKAKSSAELIEAMKKAYPTAGLGIALDLGAKVNKGEMKW